MSKIILKYIFASILLVFALNLAPQRAEAIKIGIVDSATEVVIGTSKPASLFKPGMEKSIYQLEAMKPYRVKAMGDSIGLQIQGKYFNLGMSQIIITPTSKGFISTKKRWYRGEFIIINKNGSLIVVNNIPLEEYILGVVPSEMPSKWNIEALKAQAIAARSYAIANRGKRASRGYDLKDTPEDQAYGGASSETASTNKAVAETKGIVVTYNKKIIPAYYSASAGGHTINSGEVWNKDLPFLRSVPSFDDGISKNGHGIGMSQHGANNLASQGYNAYQILSYYYNNVKFGRLDPSWAL